MHEFKELKGFMSKSAQTCRLEFLLLILCHNSTSGTLPFRCMSDVSKTYI